MKRRELTFLSGQGLHCAAWHYGPEDSDELRPLVVMAHGFGGTRNAGLEPYAERFAAEGFGVLLFDYRHFGASEGEPRQLLSVAKQLEDWRSAVAFARHIQGVDPERIALWGSSFSGGHVVVTAAQDHAVRCVVSQGSMIDGLQAFWIAARDGGPRASLAITGHALWDVVAGLFGSAHYLPIVGQPRSVAMLTSADTEAGYAAIAPADFDNRVAARIALAVPTYRPLRYAADVRCPVLLQILEADTLVSTAAAEELGRRLGDRAEVIRYPNEHFDIYVPPLYDEAIEAQLDFLRRQLA
ncbi:MAG: alpha/beta hydrolase [Deltaproteobacteria bacterium]|nr:alpha/beta hydrolase [Deltaproteobacteria bacterium]